MRTVTKIKNSKNPFFEGKEVIIKNGSFKNIPSIFIDKKEFQLFFSPHAECHFIKEDGEKIYFDLDVKIEY